MECYNVVLSKIDHTFSSFCICQMIIQSCLRVSGPLKKVKLITCYVGVRGGFWEEFFVWSTLLILGDHFSLFLADPLVSCIESGVCSYNCISSGGFFSLYSGVHVYVCTVTEDCYTECYGAQSVIVSYSVQLYKLLLCANILQKKYPCGLPAILF